MTTSPELQPQQHDVVVPVLIDFDQLKCVGTLRIQSSALPPTPEFVFSLGFTALEHDVAKLPCHEIPRFPYIGAYKLESVSIVPDEKYIGYLRQIGRLGTPSAAAREDARQLRLHAAGLNYSDTTAEAEAKHRLHEIAMRIESGYYP